MNTPAPSSTQLVDQQKNLSTKLIELASGIDGLYLSGRAAISSTLENRLEDARNVATTSGEPTPLHFGDHIVVVAPHAFLRYRYSLSHPYGRIGITSSPHFPAIRVQPRAEFLHGVGPRETVTWFQSLLEDICGPVLFSVNRLDLFADFKGWSLHGDSRHEFLCRAKSLHVYEEDDVFNGLVFGRRESGTVTARLYDKTIEPLRPAPRIGRPSGVTTSERTSQCFALSLN